MSFDGVPLSNNSPNQAGTPTEVHNICGAIEIRKQDHGGVGEAENHQEEQNVNRGGGGGGKERGVARIGTRWKK